MTTEQPMPPAPPGNPARPPSFARAIFMAAAGVVVLGGVALARDVLGPVLLGLFFAILCRPAYVWLQQRGVRPALALTLITLLLTAIVLLLGGIIAVSVAQLLDNLARYEEQIAANLQALNDWLASFGIVVDVSALVNLFDVSLVFGVLGNVASSAGAAVFTLFNVLLIILFLLVDLPGMLHRMTAALGDDHPFVSQLASFSTTTVRYFLLRTYLNAATGFFVAIALWLLGIDFAPLWGVIMFFLSYVPYIGLFVAAAPPVVLALAEFGIGRALLVIIGITVVNMVLENVVMPGVVGKGVGTPPAVVFISFFAWTALLGAAGALLAVFLTDLVRLTLASFPDTRWLASLISSTPVTSPTTQPNPPPVPEPPGDDIAARAR